MIKVVVGTKDRVIATHPASDIVDLEAYAGVRQKAEKLEVVTVPEAAVTTEEERDPSGVSVMRIKVVLVAGWRDMVVTE